MADCQLVKRCCWRGPSFAFTFLFWSIHPECFLLFDRAEPEPIFTLLGDPLLESKGDHRCHGAISLSYPGPTANAGQKKRNRVGGFGIKCIFYFIQKEVKKMWQAVFVCLLETQGTGRHISAYLNEHWPTWKCSVLLLGVSVGHYFGVCLMSPRPWHGLRVCSLITNACLPVSAGPSVTERLQLIGSAQLHDWQLGRM